jgi:hypothetical protein
MIGMGRPQSMPAQGKRVLFVVGKSCQWVMVSKRQLEGKWQGGENADGRRAVSAWRLP